MNSKDFKTTVNCPTFQINFFSINAYFQWTQGYFSPFIDIYNISVDSFFLLSGVLIVNSFFREMKRNGRVNIFRMYLHRYLRITPALAMLILVQKFIRFFNDGPFYNGFTKNFQVKCDKYWWSALLHVQNYVNPLQTVSFILNFVQLKQLNRQLKLLLVLEPLVVFVR